jgi:site-specific DNA-adenine methylase
MKNTLSPILKWAGSKYTAPVTDEILDLYQRHRANINDDAVYIAPFGGALGDLYRIRPDRALIGDTNRVLILLYQLIAEDKFGIAELVWCEDNDELIFTLIRSRFNALKNAIGNWYDDNLEFSDVVELGKYNLGEARNENIAAIIENGEERFWEVLELGEYLFEDHLAAQCALDLVWLNSTAFNGLYRENKKGDFNAPIGRRADRSFNVPCLPQQSSISLLTDREWSFYCGDYRAVETAYDEMFGGVFTGDFIYADPMYFGSGAMYGGGAENIDYEHLAYMLLKWHGMGNTVAITNANVPEMINLYRDLGFDIIETNYRQSISQKPNTRGKVKEILAYKMQVL